jgi:hypothetical protein
MAYTDDPVLRLLPPEPPDSFLALPAAEQAWRGRMWISMYGAGYDPGMAWWFVLGSGDKDWEAWAKDQIAQLPDEAALYAMMIRDRQQQDAELARQGRLPQ